jgi:hypothetical protein
VIPALLKYKNQYQNGSIRIAVSEWQYQNGSIRMAVSEWQYQNGSIRMAVSEWQYQNGNTKNQFSIGDIISEKTLILNAYSDTVITMLRYCLNFSVLFGIYLLLNTVDWVNK